MGMSCVELLITGALATQPNRISWLCIGVSRRPLIYREFRVINAVVWGEISVDKDLEIPHR